MGTGTPNDLALTPVSGVVRPRTFGAALKLGTHMGAQRSHPAERDATFSPPMVKPVAPVERPTTFSPATRPLEPARVPVPGAIPG